MKIRKKPIIISLLSLVLCLSVIFGMMNGSPAKENIVEVTASIAGNSPMPRVSQTSDNRYTFDNGDKIHIVGWYGDEGWDKDLSNFRADPDVLWGRYNWWNDAVSTFDAKSGKWNTDNYMRWQNGEGLDHHFVAWWPENIIKSNENLTAVDVTVTGNYEKDDILLARWSDKHPADNVLNLKFAHLLSRFDVHLYFRDEYAGVDIDSISIETNLPNRATVDLLAGKVTATSGEGITMQSFDEPKSGYDWSGTCITVPQVFDGNLLTIKFTVNGEQKSIDYKHIYQLNFSSGDRTTLYLLVGKDKVELMDVSVGEWDQKNINAGEAEECMHTTYENNYCTVCGKKKEDGQ